MNRTWRRFFPLLFSTVLYVSLSGCGSSRPPDTSGPSPAPPPQEPPPVASSDSTMRGIPGEDANVAFRVSWDGSYVAGTVVVRDLIRHATVVNHRSGGDPNSILSSPSATTYTPITLLREPGIDDAFERWAHKVFTATAPLGSEVSLADYRKDVRIEVYNADGLIAVYTAYRCWPSEHTPAALPEGAEQEYREWLVLQCDSWERDTAVQ